MTSTDAQRLDLYNGLKEVLGTERATILMTYIPTAPAPDLLTRSDLKADLAELKAELKADMAGLKADLAQVHRRIDRVHLAMVAGLFVVVAAVFTAALL